MKKNMIVFGAVAIALLMVSTATAVEHVNNEPAINCNPDEYTLEDFIKFLMSSDFINFLTSQEIVDFINSNEFLELYNDDEFQVFLESEEFKDFEQCYVARYLLRKYKERTREEQSLMESTDVNNKYAPSGCQSEDSAVGMNSYMQTIVVCDETEESLNAPSQNIMISAPGGGEEDALLVAAFILVGLLTWPVALLVFGAGAPLWGIFSAWWYYQVRQKNGLHPPVLETAHWGRSVAGRGGCYRVSRPVRRCFSGHRVWLGVARL